MKHLNLFRDLTPKEKQQFGIVALLIIASLLGEIFFMAVKAIH